MAHTTLAQESKPSRLVSIGLPTFVGIVAAALVLVRMPPDFLMQNLWAEDGSMHLQCAVQSGPVHCLRVPTQGYFAIVPRVLVMPAALLPPSLAPLAIHVGFAFAFGLAAAFIANRARQLSLSIPVAIFAGLVTGFLPGFSLEVLGSIANIQAVIAPVALWALLPERAPSRSPGREILNAVAVAVIVLISPIAVCFLPVAIWRWYRTRPTDQVGIRAWVTPTWGRLPVASYVLFGAIFALVFALNKDQRGIDPSPGSIADRLSWMVQFFSPLLASTQPNQRLASGAVALLAIIVLVAVAYIWGSRWNRTAMVLLAVTALAALSIVAPQYGPAPRYAQGFMAIAMVLCAIALDVWYRRGAFGKVPLILASLCLVAITALQFYPSGSRATGSNWNQNLAIAQAYCAANPGSTVIIDTAPLRKSPVKNWSIKVPCRYVLEQRR